MLLSQDFLLVDDVIEPILFGSNISLNGTDFCLQLFTSCNLIVQISCISSCLSFVLLGLREDIVIGDFTLVDLVVKSSQLVLSSLRFFIFKLEFSYKLLMVIFSLMKSLIQFSIDRLIIPDKSFQIFQFLNVRI